MSTLKILYISQSADLNNGAERCLLTLVKHLDRERFTPVVVLPYEGLFKKELDRHGIKNHVMALSHWVVTEFKGTETASMMQRAELVASLIRDEKIDIVHSNTSIVIEGAIAALLTGKPHLWHLHEILRDHGRLRLMLPLHAANKFIELMSDSVVVVSKVLSDAVREDVSPERIRLIYSGIEPAGDAGAASVKDELGFERDDILVCTIGPIRKEKGYEAFIDAAHKALKMSKKNLKFVSVGNAEDMRLKFALSKKIKAAGTGDRIKFLGYRADARRIQAGADIYVVSSTTESFSLAAVEAMDAGVPIVATRCGGPEELLKHGETGLLVPVNDSDAMAGAIVSLAEDPEKRERMGRRCAEYSKRFVPEKYVGGFEELYTGLKKRRMLNKDDERLRALYLDMLTNMEEALDMRSRVFLDSFSWKITAPVRWLIGKVAKRL